MHIVSINTLSIICVSRHDTYNIDCSNMCLIGRHKKYRLLRYIPFHKDIPSLECALRCAAQSPPGCCGGRHLEMGVQEAVKTPVKDREK